jgi:hypothetical protein
MDEFADRNIPIGTIERASGLIATELLTISYDARSEADCGTLNGRQVYPTHAIYNVLIRGDSSRGTVKATMRWVRVNKSESVTCSTTHQWEARLEDRVKQRAERPAASRPVRDTPRIPPASAKPKPTPVPAEPEPASVAPAAPVPARRDSVRFTCEALTSAPLQNPEDEYRRQRVADLRRLGIVDCVEQIPPDLVRVMVGRQFRSLSPDERDARFERLRGTYGSWGDVFMELWTAAGKFAEYGRRGYREDTKPRTPERGGDRNPE